MPRTRTTLLPTALRENVVVSPNRVPHPLSQDFEMEVVLGTTDLTDSANRIGLAIEGTFDNEQSWRSLVSSQWAGGMTGRDGNPIIPRIGYTSSLKPDRVRLVLNLVRPQVCSADLIEAERANESR